MWPNRKWSKRTNCWKICIVKACVIQTYFVPNTCKCKFVHSICTMVFDSLSLFLSLSLCVRGNLVSSEITIVFTWTISLALKTITVPIVISIWIICYLTRKFTRRRFIQTLFGWRCWRSGALCTDLLALCIVIRIRLERNWGVPFVSILLKLAE